MALILLIVVFSIAHDVPEKIVYVTLVMRRCCISMRLNLLLRSTGLRVHITEVMHILIIYCR